MTNEERNQLVHEIAAWLRHIDRLEEIPGACLGMPHHNPLWDAAGALEYKFMVGARGSDDAVCRASA